MISIERILLAGAVAGIGSVLSSWMITGVAFHPFQARTPETWRAEGAVQYAAASGLTVIAALLISMLFAATGGVHVVAGPARLANGLIFGAMCWGALALPVLLSMAIFVNVHRGVVLGLLLDWLVASLLAGGVAGWLLVS